MNHAAFQELMSSVRPWSRREAQAWVDGFPRQEVLFVIEFTAQDAAAEVTGSVFDDDIA